MSEHYGNCPRVGFWDAGEFDAPCTCDGKNTRAPVESVTVSGERKWNRATVNEVGYQLGLAHAEGRVTSRELTHTVEFVLDNAVRVGLVVPAPPLSPATPSAEIDRCTCGHTKALHDGPDHEGECVHEDAGHRFCPCEIFVPKAAPATPSVTVEEVERVTKELLPLLAGVNTHNASADGIEALANRLARAALSLPRAPAKETSAVEASASVVEAARALMRAIDPATYRTSWREFKVHSSAYESEFMALHKALAASPRSAVEAEVVEAAKAVHEAGSVLARHFNGPFAVWTAWNVACETLDRALARAQEGRGT